MALFSSIQAQQSLDSLRLVLPELGNITTFGLSPKKKYIWISKRDNSVSILERKSKKILYTFNHTEDGDLTLAIFSEDEQYILLSFYYSSRVFIYSIKEGKQIQKDEHGYNNCFSFFTSEQNILGFSTSGLGGDTENIYYGLINQPYDSLSICCGYPHIENYELIFKDYEGLISYNLLNKHLNRIGDFKIDGELLYGSLQHRSALISNSLYEKDECTFVKFDENGWPIKKIKIPNKTKYLSQITPDELCFYNLDTIGNLTFFSFNLLQGYDLKEIGNMTFEEYTGLKKMPKEFFQFVPQMEVRIEQRDYMLYFRFGDIEWSSSALKLKNLNSGLVEEIFFGGALGDSHPAFLNVSNGINNIKYGPVSIELSPLVNIQGYKNFNDSDTFNITLIQSMYRKDTLFEDGWQFFEKEYDSIYLQNKVINQSLSVFNSNENTYYHDRWILKQYDSVNFHVLFTRGEKMGMPYSIEFSNVYGIKKKGEFYESIKLNFPTQKIINAIAIDKSYNHLVYSTQTDLIGFKELKTKRDLFFLQLLKNNNWLVKLPNSPYYMCSKDASKMLHYVTPSLKVIGFEQLDPVYNRPDIVLDSIGKYFDNEDGGMIEEYRKSWEKRIHKLGLDIDKLGKGEIAVPSAEIVGADDIAYENKDGKLRIKISATDVKYPLRRFNVFVNEVPLYGSAGISIAHLNKQIWDTTVTIPLSHGDNKIQVSVMNELGLENFKYPTYVNYTPKEEVVSKTYFIGIGVNEFKDATHNLTFCEQDVRDLASAFSGKHSEITLLTNEQVTREKILSLKELLLKTTVNDKVIISCSSHGLLDDSLNFYLATHDLDFEHPKSRGLRYEELEGLLDGIPARQKLLLLDACNSGENDKLDAGNQVFAQNQAIADSIKIGRGAKAKYAKTDNQKFIQINELFVNVRNNTGSVIISAAGGQQNALEGEAVKVDGKAIQNGAFTYCVLEYLKQHEGDAKALTVVQLKQYVEKRVEEITNGQQKPTSRQETMEIDWDVRKLP
jgi:hypothetical protein